MILVACAGEGPRPPAPARTTTPDASVAVLPPPPAPEWPTLPLVPYPRSVTQCTGALPIEMSTEIIIDDDPNVRAIAQRLARWVDVPPSRVRVIPAGAPGPPRAIVLRLDGHDRDRDPAQAVPSDLDDEAYSLSVTPPQAVVRAKHLAGLFYGAQTLAQIASSRPILASSPLPLQPHRVPCVTIEDAPTSRFRAMHLDVSRHFFSKEIVERYIDILSFYRFNVFHWHLTDDQGFRLAIKSHPELTQFGPSYSQEDAREVVAFAKDRFVTVIPEIEVPGHARAILASHPELSCTGKKQDVPTTFGIFEDVLCAGNPKTFDLVADILRETTEVFPSQLVHLGGDEVPKKRWNECPKCRARMQHEHLDAEQLQGAFMKRAGEMLAARGRRTMAWDEAIDGGITKDSLIVAWQSADRGVTAARAGYDVVMAPHVSVYFNFWQSRSGSEPGHRGHLPWTRVLAFEPVPGGLDASVAAHFVGAEGTLWTEFVRTADDLDTLLLPRVGALAERLWGPRAESSESLFVQRFTAQRHLLDASDVRYFVEPPTGLRAQHPFVGEGALVLGRPQIHPDGLIRFTLDGSDPDTSSPIYAGPVALHAATKVQARLFLPGGRKSEPVTGAFDPAAFLRAVPDVPKLRAGVVYKYFEGDFHAVPDFTKTPPLRAGRLDALGYAPDFRAERFAVAYDAFVRVPTDGVYRFAATSDDGISVDIDGKQTVNDDGDHAARLADGEIALAAGLHRIHIGYFQGAGGKALRLECEGPGMPLATCPLLSP